MGEVYLARDDKLDRKVALKILPAELAINRDKVERFVREAKSAAALNHPNIATVHEIGQHEGTHFIVMEFIDGVTLREKIHRERTDLSKLLRYLQDVAEGLAKAHAAGIVHRDLKPDNIMLTRDGNAKILDFGLAKLIETTGPSGLGAEGVSAMPTAMLAGHSLPGTVLGTVGYMSPEQAQGRVNDIDHRSDIFSFGCILFEAGSGRKPFEGQDALDSLHKIVHAPTPQIRDVNPSAPVEMQRIVRRCLAKDPDERYQSIKEVAIELRELRRELSGARQPEATAPSSSGSSSTASGATTASSAAMTTAPAPSAEFIITEIKRHKIAAIIALLVLTLGGIWLARYLRHGNTETSIDSIAVLPFVNVSGDPNTEYLSDGITESLINSFSQLQPKLRVIPRSTVFRYQGQQLDPQEIGRKLGVRAVLTGRVLQHGDTVSIQTELIDVDQQSQIWGEQYNRRLLDILAVQAEIGNEISEKLRLQLSGEEKKKLAKRYTENPEAYQLYLKGVYHSAKFSKQELDLGNAYLRQAVAVDPNYALAYHGLAYYYCLVVDLTLPPNEAMPKAKEAAKRALAIDDTLAVAHGDMGFVHWLYDWDWVAAEKEFKRAIELDPNDALTHESYGWYLVTMGRFEEGIAEASKSQQIEPLFAEHTSVLGWDLYLAHRYDESIQQHRKAIELDPEYWIGYSWLGHALAQKGQLTEAIAAFKKATSVEKVIAEPLVGLGRVYAVSGNKQEALRVLDELKDSSKRPYVSSYLIATLYAGLGDNDQAFVSLEKAYEDRSWYMTHLNLDPELKPLHSDPRFNDLVKRVGLP